MNETAIVLAHRALDRIIGDAILVKQDYETLARICRLLGNTFSAMAAKGHRRMKMKEKCIIKSAEKPSGNCLVRLSPATYKRLQEIALKTSRSSTSIATELMEFALDRVEIEYQYGDDCDQREEI